MFEQETEKTLDKTWEEGKLKLDLERLNISAMFQVGYSGCN